MRIEEAQALASYSRLGNPTITRKLRQTGARLNGIATPRRRIYHPRRGSMGGRLLP